MCGRLRLDTDETLFRTQYDIDRMVDVVGGLIEGRYNIAPTQQLLVVTAVAGGWIAQPMRWGLIPPWADPAQPGPPIINARAETVATKPTFRGAVRRRRCLVPASAFYEWRRCGSRRQPYHIGRGDGALMSFAGLWEECSGSAGPVRSCAIITCGANALMAPIHDRMPVILDQDAEAAWLDPATPLEQALSLLTPCPDDALAAYPVSTRVNRATYDAPDCVEPVAQATLLL